MKMSKNHNQIPVGYEPSERRIKVRRAFAIGAAALVGITGGNKVAEGLNALTGTLSGADEKPS